ncbi:Hypothetical protein AA314_05374 [Archangium gephyra]|uniref:Uncharacterized protein n=1 Tax=Archangium gephyra TaxID=48 RepID=A0AAC8TF78_9BACT|nr:Hypothetical protein AA314_05374 [Archangium gephyra]
MARTSLRHGVEVTPGRQAPSHRPPWRGSSRAPGLHRSVRDARPRSARLPPHLVETCARRSRQHRARTSSPARAQRGT